MADQRYITGHWWDDPREGAYVHIKAGYYDVDQTPETDYAIPFDMLPGLIEHAREHGMLPIITTEQSRTEDLKIIHRSLDIIDKVASAFDVSNED